jgi:hypothetical protein
VNCPDQKSWHTAAIELSQHPQSLASELVDAFAASEVALGRWKYSRRFTNEARQIQTPTIELTRMRQDYHYG